MKPSAPLISVCIPLYRTEPFLAQCLGSVLLQDFDDFEVVIVSDASDGVDAQGRRAGKIIKSVQKECTAKRKKLGLKKVSLRFIENRENRGLFEVRRTLVTEAKAVYITQCDSDDTLEEGALKAFYSTVQNGLASGADYDIVHGTSTAGTFDEAGNFTPTKNNVHSLIYYGELKGRDIFRGWLLEHKCTANTWGKLIKREIYLEAYNLIPYTECNLAEDVLHFVFISHLAKSYIGIRDKVYRYRVNVGMTGANKITSLDKWKLSCSAASVFGIISTILKAEPDELEALKKLACGYVANNLQTLKNNVVPELQKEAYDMLCDYWGRDFVEIIENKSI